MVVCLGIPPRFLPLAKRASVSPCVPGAPLGLPLLIFLTRDGFTASCTVFVSALVDMAYSCMSIQIGASKEVIGYFLSAYFDGHGFILLAVAVLLFPPPLLFSFSSLPSLLFSLPVSLLASP